MSENPTVVVPCPRCGQMGSGNFCNHCGANMHAANEKDTDPFIAFASGFFNIKNTKRYLQLYFRMLSSPVANTIKAYQVISFDNALKFLQLSVAFYTLLTAGKVLYTTLSEKVMTPRLWNEVFAETFYLIAVVGGYLILLKFFYMFASKRWGKKDKHDYVKMYCLFAGFLLPLNGLLLYFNFELFETTRFAKTTFFIVLTFLLNLVFGTALLLYGHSVWQYFWKGPGLKVLQMLLLATLISYTICFTAIVIVFASLKIDLVQQRPYIPPQIQVYPKSSTNFPFFPTIPASNTNF